MVYDIAIIGAGPGGYTAAVAASKQGYKVVVIENEELGGTCLNWGCIPTKTYYKNADFLKDLRSSGFFGVAINDYTFSLSDAKKRKDEVIAQLKKGITQLLNAHQITYIQGKASFLSSTVLEISGETKQEIEAETIIVATGSKTRQLGVKGADHPDILDSQTILELTELPKDLLIIGGGVIGIEFACIFNYFGSNVHVVEYTPDILSGEDRELIKRFTPLLKKQGVTLSVSTEVIEIAPSEEGFSVTVKDKKGQLETLTYSHVLQAAGRIANIDGLQLENAAVKAENGAIAVDADYRTTADNIFAVGDVNGKIMLAHAAAHQGLVVINGLTNPQKGTHNELIPACTFSFPEISSAGLTEEQVKEKGIEYKKNKFLFAANGKALSLGEKDGFVKVIADLEGKILGVHILGPHASDLIHQAALAIQQGMVVNDIADMIHAHPTLSEAFHEAVAGIAGKSIHQI